MTKQITQNRKQVYRFLNAVLMVLSARFIERQNPEIESRLVILPRLEVFDEPVTQDSESSRNWV